MKLHPYDQCGIESGKEPSTELSCSARKLFRRISAKGSACILIEEKEKASEMYESGMFVGGRCNMRGNKISRKTKYIDICNLTKCFLY